ncbi:MAG: HNH endonuclease, partial [Planctomycetota bacterium]
MDGVALLERPTLVLNRHWTPLHTLTTRAAIGLVAKGSAKIIDPIDYEVHDLHSWHAVSQARQSFSAGIIRSQRLCLVPPEVIVLTYYAGMGDQSVTFSRWN